MKKSILIILSITSFQTFGQEKKAAFKSYQAIDYMLLFNANSDKESYYDGNTGQMEEPSKFILGGLAGHFEYGIAYKEWLRVGMLTGIYANFFDSAYTVPIAPTVTLAPLIGGETRIYGKVAYGWNTAIGRGNLNGMFSHYHFGVELGGGSRIFLFASDHQFRLKQQVYRTLGIGFGGTLFKDKK